MGKERTIYRTFTTNDLKTRSDIPAQGDIAEHTGHIDCVNISLSAVKTLISASTYSLYDICNHANINKWSGFGPFTRSIDGNGHVVNTLKGSPVYLGDFAGYDHSAVTPGHIGSSRTASVGINGSGGTATKICSVTIGQPKYSGGDLTNDDTVVGVGLFLYDGSTFIGGSAVDLDDCNDEADLTATTSALSVTTTITGKVFLTDAIGTVTESNIRGHWTQIADFNFDAIMLLANHIDVSNGDFRISHSGPDSYLVVGDCSFTKAGGGNGHATITFPNIHSHDSNAGISITVILSHIILGTIDSILYMDNVAYTANDTITGTTIEFDTAITEDYGYTFEFLIDLST